MNTVIDDAIAIISPVGAKYEPANEVYYVVVGTDRGMLNEHGSLENYCKDCIDAAVIEKKRDFFLERMAEMGKIYEYHKCGFYRQPEYKCNKEDGNLEGLIIKKIRAKEPREKVVKYLEKQLRKKYPANMIFDYRYTSGSETDDFDFCESCSIIFNQGVLLSSQELDHWEKHVTDQNLEEWIYDPRHAFMLEKILDHGQYETEHTSRIVNLAARIIAAKNVTI